MSNDHTESVWLTIAVIMIGIGSVVVFSLQPGGGAVTTSSQAQMMPLTSSTIEPNTDDPRAVGQTTTEVPSAITEPSSVPSYSRVAALMPTPTPSPVASMTAIPPLVLPEVPVPENGEVYLLYPANPASVGWARANDEVANHFGDYNIFAGVFEGEDHVGAMQFDLSQIPPGSPILYADLALTGLVSDYRGTEGVWTLQMLDEWMDLDWTTRDFSWLAREDSGTVVLNDPVASAALDVGKTNIFSIPPEGLGLLEARLFTHSVSFRITGPSEGPDNLFGWDSGFGTRSMGRAPVLRIVTGGPAVDAPPSPTPNYVVITPVPSDGYALLALAAERLTATAMATPDPLMGTASPTVTPTPMPPNWVTPVIVTNTPTPENQVTASWWAQMATAQEIVRGTATATPPNVWTATSTPLPPPTPLIMAYDSFTPTPTPTTTPGAIPDFLPGKILFYSDRMGSESLMVMEPDGSNVNVWTGEAPEWVYAQAKNGESLAPAGDFQVVVSNQQISSLQLWTVDIKNGTRFQLTRFEEIAYDPVWSPVDNTIAFVSPDPGNDEIFLINADGTGLTRLTTNEWEWDKHPSWSPDGSRLVFWSNRDTQRKQIWVMNRDGSNLRNLSNNDFNDWDPVWVK
ncbi:MAG: PD40 domain-containing protein [Caldilineaceae bacterium]|nr:PD40 domain-containing protein [Caldilineaceae bacterium]